MGRLLCLGARSVLFLAELESLMQPVVVQIFLGREPAAMASIHARTRALAADPSPQPWARILDVGTLDNGHAYAVFGYSAGVDYTPLVTGSGT